MSVSVISRDINKISPLAPCKSEGLTYYFLIHTYGPAGISLKRVLGQFVLEAVTVSYFSLPMTLDLTF